MADEDVQKILEELSRELQESKARLEEAQRIAQVGHYYWNLIENRVIWSDELYRIYGLDPQEGPIDMALVREMIHPEDREFVFRAAEEALKQSQFYLSEGQRLAHIGSWAAKDLGVRWSDDLGIYWSEEVYKIYGLDPQNGAPNLEQYLASIHPDDRASMAETIRLMHEQRCGCDVTKRIVRPDGEVRYVRCVGVPVFEGGVFKAFHGTTMDVTEHELLTQELRRESAYLTEAQSLTHTGSWACNLLTSEILHSSDENARLYGFDPSQGAIPFDRFYNAILREDEVVLRPKLENAIREGADYDVEFRIRRTDGAIRFLRGIGHHNPSQEIGEYVGITMDITERKQAEQEREKLRQLEADLAHINRVNMMGELAAALAHEIRQPIAASITSANACLRWLARDPPDLE